jgi:hypothetical protein
VSVHREISLTIDKRFSADAAFPTLTLVLRIQAKPLVQAAGARAVSQRRRTTFRMLLLIRPLPGRIRSQ